MAGGGKLTDSDFLRADYNIDTPENVSFGYELAGIGSRFIGALVDSSIIGLALILLNFLLFVVLSAAGDLESMEPASGSAASGSELSWIGALLLAVYALVNFLIFWGYYVLFELRWNGQTPGKRLAHTRVVRADGNPAGFLEIAVRNLLRIVDFMPSGYAFGFLVMFFSRQARRLGDYAAGTLVVKERRDVTLDSLSEAQASAPAATDLPERPVPYPGAGRLALGDYHLIRDVLRRAPEPGIDPQLVSRLAGAIAAKLAVPRPAEEECVRFLEEVAGSYRGGTRFS